MDLDKKSIIEEFKINENDTGSLQIQIAFLTLSIKNLAKHLNINKKDLHSKVGLLKKINKRKKFLNYLKKNDNDYYKILLKKLNLRK